MMDRVAGRYWSEEAGKKTLEESLHKDNAFKEYEASKIRTLARLVTDHLDDLAVLLLFSVFEAGGGSVAQLSMATATFAR